MKSKKYEEGLWRYSNDKSLLKVQYSFYENYNLLESINNISYNWIQLLILGAKVYTLLVDLRQLTELKLNMAEIEKQFAKTRKLKNQVFIMQQATVLLQKSMLHQSFKMEKMEEV